MDAHYIYSRKVTFAETDSAGCVHFSNYLRWLEEAESSFLESIGESMITFKGDDPAGFPKARVECDYLSPVYFGDKVDIHLRVEKLRSCGLMYIMDIYRGDSLVAKAKLNTVYVTKNPEEGEANIFKAQELPVRLVEKLQGVMA